MKKRKNQHVTMISAEDPGWHPGYPVTVDYFNTKRTRFSKRNQSEPPLTQGAAASFNTATDLKFAKSMLSWCLDRLHKNGTTLQTRRMSQKKELKLHELEKEKLDNAKKSANSKLQDLDSELQMKQQALTGATDTQVAIFLQSFRCCLALIALD